MEHARRQSEWQYRTGPDAWQPLEDGVWIDAPFDVRIPPSVVLALLGVDMARIEYRVRRRGNARYRDLEIAELDPATDATIQRVRCVAAYTWTGGTGILALDGAVRWIAPSLRDWIAPQWLNRYWERRADRDPLVRIALRNPRMRIPTTHEYDEHRQRVRS